MTEGKFFAIVGGEVSGKSTQLLRVSQKLMALGYGIMIGREPGGSAIGEQLRKIVKDPAYAGLIQPKTSFFLFNASRHQFVREVVQPAIRSGKLFITDRWRSCTIAYQGYGENLDFEMVREATLWAVDDLHPDKIFWLDISLEEMKKRLTTRKETFDRYEAMGWEFHERVRQGYLAQLDDWPYNMERIGGERAVETITDELVGKIVDVVNP